MLCIRLNLYFGVNNFRRVTYDQSTRTISIERFLAAPIAASVAVGREWTSVTPAVRWCKVATAGDPRTEGKLTRNKVKD